MQANDTGRVQVRRELKKSTPRRARRETKVREGGGSQVKSEATNENLPRAGDSPQRVDGFTLRSFFLPLEAMKLGFISIALLPTAVAAFVPQLRAYPKTFLLKGTSRPLSDAASKADAMRTDKGSSEAKIVEALESPENSPASIDAASGRSSLDDTDDNDSSSGDEQDDVVVDRIFNPLDFWTPQSGKF